MAVVRQVIILSTLMLFGLLAQKRGMVNEGGVKGLSTVLLNFSLPCLAFVKLQRPFDAVLFRGLVQVFALSGVIMLITYAATRLVFIKAPHKRRSVFIHLCMFSNASFMGFPVHAAAFGPDYLIYGVVYVSMFNLLTWSIGLQLYTGEKISPARLLKIPALTASVLGLVLFVVNVQLPAIVNSALDLMGSITTPLAMFIVGIRLSELRLRSLKDPYMILTILMRLVVLPLAVHFALLPLHLDGIVHTTLTLFTAMPCAATTAIQAENYGGDAALASQGVALTTAFSLATIPLLLPLLLG